MNDNDNLQTSEVAERIRADLSLRFGENFAVDPAWPGLDELKSLTGRRVLRRYRPEPVAPGLLRLLCAAALSAPSKSDLQQADILIVRDQNKRAVIEGLLTEMPWVKEAPVFLVFLANGRRIPRLAAAREKPFPNRHLDMFFNASVDAAIVLASFIRAADAVGLGCCPISVIRDHSARISELLELPERVIPVAGMTLGWPAEKGYISPRLPLDVTVHEDSFKDDDLLAQVDAYDRRRAGIHKYRPRDPARWGEAKFYGWSEDKARQYGVPQRADFGAFVRGKGFSLD
jgi:nitroreductase/FMN reductase [NAD(P)H]